MCECVTERERECVCACVCVSRVHDDIIVIAAEHVLLRYV